MCRAYGAQAAPVTPTQAFRPGLNSAAPTALKFGPAEAYFRGSHAE